MTRYFSLALGIAGALFLALSSNAAFAAKRVALVVGNSTYQSVARLPNPEKDAASIGKLFKDAGFDTVVVENNVGNLDFKRAIRKFEDAAVDAEIAVVFYAGHGIEIGGVNYLIPVDAKLVSDRDASDEAITLERLVEAVDGAKRLRLIILDACRDNPFAASMKRTSRTASRGISAGLGKVEPTTSDTLIAYAAKGGSTAEDGDGDHSPFTTALLSNLTAPGLDIRLAFGRVRDDVIKITSRRQEPFVYGSLGGGNISLVPAPEQAKEPESAKVQSDYELVAQVGSKKAWEVFLNTYKSGFYADLARAQLAKLGNGVPPEAAPPEPPKATSDEQRAWSKLKDSSDKSALEEFIHRYPNSPLALNAQRRLDILERAAKEREEKARAEREAAQRAADERRAKEVREAALRAEEAARRADEERRAKAATEAERQKVQEQIAREQLACRREQAQLDDLKAAASSTSVRDDLKRLSQELTCARLRPQVMASLDKVTSDLNKSSVPPVAGPSPQLIVAVQKELARLGCYSGDNDGKLNAATKVALKNYHSRKGEPDGEAEVTDDLVSELGKQRLRVCPAAIVEKPRPERQPKKEARQERSKPARTEVRPRVQQQAGGGSASHPIGVGF